MLVYLIGAGPGDPGLLTMKGARALSGADVVVYDYLACEDLLALARPDAELVYVGKVAGNHAMPQAQINSLLIAKAREGKTVARLKGGDPYIFGRGGEEAEELVAAGIPFEEIPGISSTVAGPAYAGIPLTHRDFASSVTLITGHENPDKPGSVHNWKALAQSASTLVFVMGMQNLPRICKNLMDAGMPAATPAALVHWGTTPQQRSLASTLENLPEESVRQHFTNPSVIVVGNVVKLREKLNWFEKKPLYGRSIVVTRAREQASDLAAALRGLGADVIQFPTIAITPVDDYSALDAALGELSHYHWLIFTSVNGVRFFRERMALLGQDSRALGGVKVAAIGPATAEAVTAMGICPDFVPAAYIAEDVAAGLTALGMKDKRVLLPRAREAREVLPEELEKAGATVNVVPVYETRPTEENMDEVLQRLENDNLDCITFGSSSTVKNFLNKIAPEKLTGRKTRLACIGPVTAATLASYGLKAHIQPEKFSIPDLVQALTQYFNQESKA